MGTDPLRLRFADPPAMGIDLLRLRFADPPAMGTDPSSSLRLRFAADKGSVPKAPGSLTPGRSPLTNQLTNQLTN